MKVFVLGAGVAGLAFASFAEDLDLTVIDSNDFAGRKLLATGNGRCNFTNKNFSYAYYQSSDPDFFKKALDGFTNEDLIDYFHQLGIATTSLPSGRCYPLTMSAKSVRDVLYLKARENAKFIFNEKIIDIDLDKGLLIGQNNKYKYDILVLAGGGITLKNSGSDGSIYKILEKFHPISKISYGITNYKTQEKLSKKAKGCKVSGKLSLYIDGRLRKDSTDDIIFQAYGLTGTAVFDLSNEISLALMAGKKPEVRVDFLPSYGQEELGTKIKTLAGRYPKRLIGQILLGLVNERLIGDILKKARIDESLFAKDLSDRDMDMLVKILKQMTFHIRDIYDRQNAQVSLGGFSTKYIDKQTMASKIYKNLYFCGEIMDVSGSCGGYNIQWAFSSAKAASDTIRSMNVQNK